MPFFAPLRLCAIIILLASISGCSTLRSVRNAVLGDDSIDGEDRVEYAKLIEEKEAEFRQYKETNRQFMPYHYAAIGMIFSGILMLILNRTTNEAGIGTILGGIGLSAWAMVAPNNMLLVTILLTVGVVSATAYIGFRLFKPAR